MMRENPSSKLVPELGMSRSDINRQIANLSPILIYCRIVSDRFFHQMQYVYILHILHLL